VTVKDRLLNVFLEEEWVMSVAEEITYVRRITDDIDEAESNGVRLTYHGELHRRYLELLERDGESLDPRQRRKIRQLFDRAGTEWDPDIMATFANLGIFVASVSAFLVIAFVGVLLGGLSPYDQRATIFIIVVVALAVAVGTFFAISLRMRPRFHRRQLEAVLELEAILPDRSGPGSGTAP